jgi:predicted RNase H-like HicB family nuclease
MQSVKIIIEQHEDGFIGYPLGFKAGAIVGQGDTYKEALDDTRSAISFYIEHYGMKRFEEAFEYESPLLNAFLDETAVAA